MTQAQATTELQRWPLSAARDVVACAAVLVSCGAVLATQSGLFRRFWFNDISYFWSAGTLWRAGVSPYADGYIDRANALVPTRHIYSAFYYAPAIRPFAELLAGFRLEDAATGFFLINLVFLTLACLLLADVAQRFRPSIRRWRWFALFAFIACVVLRHPLVVAAIGQITVLLLAALALFLHALAREKPARAIPAIVLLLMKPHFGLAVCVFCCLQPALRRPLVVALAAYAALTLYGLSTAPAESLNGFLANIAAYTDHPRHAPAHASGLGQLLAAVGVRTPTLALALLLGLGAAAVARARTARANVLAAVFLSVWTLFAGPNHMEDFAMLAPAMLLPILGAERRLPLVVIALVLVGRGHELTTALGVDSSAFLDVRTAVHTVGLAVLLVVAWFCTLEATRPALSARASGD